MKPFLLIVVAVIATIAVYDFCFAPPGERRVFPNDVDIPITIVQRPAAPAPNPEAPEAKQAMTETEPPTKQDGFVPPEFASIESITKNWSTLPPQAFPRLVTIHKPVEIKMSVGSSTMSSGAEVTALSISEGNLTVAPTPESTARGTISIQDTNLVAELTDRYGTWVQARIDRARDAWEYRQQQAKAMGAKSVAIVASADMLDSKGRPVKNAAGSYDLLLASIKSRQVTDIDPARVLRWGTPQSMDLDGVPHWVIDVFYMTDTIFGPFEAQARAFVREGRVADWRYAVSNERVQ